MSSCGNCGRPACQDFPVSKSTLAFDTETGQQLPGGNDVWLCIIPGCKNQSCTGCYMTHIESQHPEVYSVSCFTCKEVKLYKEFVEYGICKSCVDARPKEANVETQA